MNLSPSNYEVVRVIYLIGSKKKEITVLRPAYIKKTSCSFFFLILITITFTTLGNYYEMKQFHGLKVQRLSLRYLSLIPSKPWTIIVHGCNHFILLVENLILIKPPKFYLKIQPFSNPYSHL